MPSRGGGARTWSAARIGTYYRLAAAILDDQAGAEEVALRAFEAVWRRRRRITNVESFEAELLLELVRACRSHRLGPVGSSLPVQLRLSPGGPSIGEDEALAWNIEPWAEPADAARAAPATPVNPPVGADSFDVTLRRLALDDRIILVLHYATDLTAEAIAAALETTADSVEARLGQVEAGLSAAIDRDEAAQPYLRRRQHLLAEEIRRRLPLPADAPPALVARTEMRMTLVSLGRRPRPSIRLSFVIPIGVLLAALVLVGSGAWRAVANIGGPTIAPGQLPGRVDAFGRVDARTAWATRDGDLFMSHDGGASWGKTALPAVGGVFRDAARLWPDVYYPFFLDAGHGWILTWRPASSGDGFTLTVYRTGDGGRKWSASELPGVYPGFGSVQFADERHGWATIVRPETLDLLDRGDQPLYYEQRGPAGDFARLTIPDDATTLIATSDGGRTWSTISKFAGIAALRFVSEKEGWGELATTVLGYVDTIVHTTDGGRSWTRAELPGLAMMQCQSVPASRAPVADGGLLKLPLPCLQDPTISMQVGGSLAAPSQVGALVRLVSDGGGTTWNVDSVESGLPVFQTSLTLNLARTGPEQPLVAFESSVGVPPVGAFHGTAPLAGGASVSFDGGSSWQPVALPGTAPIEAIDVVAPNDVWIATGEVSGVTAWGLPGYVYASKDGGASWSSVLGAPALTGGTFLPLPMATPTPLPTAVAIDQGIVNAGFADGVGWIQTANSVWLRAGPSWQEIPLPEPGTVQVISPSELVLLAGFRSGSATGSGLVVIYLTSDAGRSWNRFALEPGDMNASTALAMPFAHFVDGQHGVVYPGIQPASGTPAGGCTRIVTDNGGASWTYEGAPCVGGATFVDALTGWALDPDVAGTADLSFLLTTDGGLTWQASTIDHPGYAFQNLLSFARDSDGMLHAVVSWSSAESQLLEVLMSTDGGAVWLRGGTLAGAYTAAAYVGPDEFVVAQQLGGGTGVSMLHTVDGGVTWEETQAAGMGDVAWLGFGGKTRGWAVPIGSCSGDGAGPACLGHYLFETSDGNPWKVVWPPVRS